MFNLPKPQPMASAGSEKTSFPYALVRFFLSIATDSEAPNRGALNLDGAAQSVAAARAIPWRPPASPDRHRDAVDRIVAEAAVIETLLKRL
jgi:hypothetical protein